MAASAVMTLTAAAKGQLQQGRWLICVHSNISAMADLCLHVTGLLRIAPGGCHYAVVTEEFFNLFAGIAYCDLA